MSKSFYDLNVSEPIIEAIKQMGFEEPTEVQVAAIPQVLERKDLIVLSQTGSGKTGAFGIPLLQLLDASTNAIEALVLTPTRELAVQVDQELVKMSRNLPCKTTAVYGQHNMEAEISLLKKGVSVVTGTPGRVMDHIKRRTLVTSKIRFLVLDEADRMLDMGFIDQVKEIVKSLPKERVTLLFSATIPDEIQKICQTYMRDPLLLELGTDIKTVDTIEQIYYRVDKKEKRMQLNRLLRAEDPDSCIIFCNTRSEVDFVGQFLSRKGYKISALHGGNTQASRTKTLQEIKDKKVQLIIATDVAARGIHIEDLSLVINYDVPNDKDNYVHRIGRTARVGNTGKAITIVTGDELWDLYAIEEHIGVTIEERELPSDAYVREREEQSASKWTKYRKEHAKKPQVTEKKKILPDKRQVVVHHKEKPKPAQPYREKPVVKKVVIQEKPQPKEIDYRAEAKKLLAKTEVVRKRNLWHKISGWMYKKVGK